MVQISKVKQFKPERKDQIRELHGNGFDRVRLRLH
jgi:hypothetical protein